LNTPYHSKALPEGTILREWRLEQVLGVGGFGIVYRGKGVYFDELVAIKEYFPGSISDRQDGTTVTPTDSSSEDIYVLGKEKFLEEAKVLWNLSKPERHPNIVSVRSLFEIHGTAYMVMDFESGVSLSQMLRDGRKFDEAGLMALMRPIAEGLDRAHKAGVIHRDIKPANILVDDTGRPVLIDFGSARFDSGQATSTKVTFYTPPYAAIEQYVKTYPQGPWTDIYALGVTLYQCVSGEKPAEVLERMHGGASEALSARDWPGFSRAFTRAVDAAMAIRPADRPQSIPEWLRLFDLNDAEAEEEATRIAVAPAFDAAATQTATYVSAANTGSGGNAGTPRRRGPALLAAAAVGVLLLAAGGAALVLRSGQPPAPKPPIVAATPRPSPAAGPSQAVVIPPVEQAADGLIADAQQAGRPDKEIAALTGARANISTFAGQIKALGAAPGAAAKAAPLLVQLNGAGVDMARGEIGALGRLAQVQAREVEHTLGGSARIAGSASAVAAVRQAQGALDAAAVPIAQASDGAAAIDAARRSIAAYGAFASAYASATRFYVPAKRAQITSAAIDVRAEAAQLTAMANVPKPWFLAAQARKHAYQQLQDNAARAKAELAQLEPIARAAAGSGDLKLLDADLARVSGLKQSLAGLRASSAAAQAAAK
jgi:non-specific serine/threonine protein kinase